MYLNKLEELYASARELPKELVYSSKDTWAVANKLIEAKYLDINDALGNKSIDISSYLAEFDSILLYPNRVLGEIVDIYIRPVFSKAAPLKLGNLSFPFGIGNLNQDFKYGDPIVLVEGIGDMIAVKLIDPKLSVISMQTVKLGNKHLNILTKITNNFIAIPDNDTKGATGYKQMFWALKNVNCSLKEIKQFNGYKDTGDFLEDLVQFSLNKSDTLKQKISNARTYYKTMLDIATK